MPAPRLLPRRRLPLSCQFLRLCNLSRSHLRGHQVAVLHRHAALRLIGAGSGQVEPLVCLYVVFRHLCNVIIHSSEVVLGVGASLISGLTAPQHCRLIVLRDAHPIRVHNEKFVLGASLAVLGEGTVGAHCCRVVTPVVSSVRILVWPSQRGRRGSTNEQKYQQAHGCGLLSAATLSKNGPPGMVVSSPSAAATAPAGDDRAML